MIALYTTDFKRSSGASLYTQLYEKIRGEILKGNARTGERLPSLRGLAQQTGLSVTTVGQAYEQLATEGYILSRPQSGYYVAHKKIIINHFLSKISKRKLTKINLWMWPKKILLYLKFSHFLPQRLNKLKMLLYQLKKN